MARGVVCGLESVYIYVHSHEHSSGALRAIDFTLNLSQASASATCSGQLVGPRILTILGSLRAVFRSNLSVVAALGAVVGCDLPVVAALGAIFGCNLPVVDGLRTVVRGIRTPGSNPGTLGGRSLAIARRAIPCGAVEITRRFVTRFSFSVTQFSRDVTILRGKAGLPTAHADHFVCPGVLPIPSGLSPILCSDLPIVYGLCAVVCGVCAPRGGTSSFLCCVLPVARGAIPFGPVEITGGVVTRFGLTVAKLGCDVTFPGSKSSLPPAHPGHLIDPRVHPVLGRLGSILGRNLPVVDRLSAVVRRISAPRGGSGTFVSGVLSVARRAIPFSPGEIPRSVIARLRLPVALLGRNVAAVRRQPGLPAARSGHLVAS